jgi:hypothetical protein
MASFSFPPLVLPAASSAPLPPGAVEAVEAAVPVALAQAELEPLPFAQQLDEPARANAAPAQDLPDAAALRPDQASLARQMTWPTQDGPALARAWRSMVNHYGAQLVGREQQSRPGLLPSVFLQSGHDPRVLREQSQDNLPPDAWRFTVQAAAARAQHLRVVEGEPEPVLGRRRRARAALRLELVLADGTVVTVQAEPFAEGVRLEMCASDRDGVARLRELQPQLQQAVERAGLRVLGWRYRDTLPAGRVHARLPSIEAASMLGLPVFRAMAELALTLPL